MSANQLMQDWPLFKQNVSFHFRFVQHSSIVDAKLGLARRQLDAIRTWVGSHRVFVSKDFEEYFVECIGFFNTCFLLFIKGGNSCIRKSLVALHVKFTSSAWMNAGGELGAGGEWESELTVGAEADKAKASKNSNRDRIDAILKLFSDGNNRPLGVGRGWEAAAVAEAESIASKICNEDNSDSPKSDGTSEVRCLLEALQLCHLVRVFAFNNAFRY